MRKLKYIILLLRDKFLLGLWNKELFLIQVHVLTDLALGLMGDFLIAAPLLPILNILTLCL